MNKTNVEREQQGKAMEIKRHDNARYLFRDSDSNFCWRV